MINIQHISCVTLEGTRQKGMETQKLGDGKVEKPWETIQIQIQEWTSDDTGERARVGVGVVTITHPLFFSK